MARRWIAVLCLAFAASAHAQIPEGPAPQPSAQEAPPPLAAKPKPPKAKSNPAPEAVIAPNPMGPTGPNWPTIAWESAPPPPGADVPAAQALLDEAFGASEGPLGETRAVVIVQSGRIVMERYAKGFSDQTRHVSWSVAKSFTQALVGIAAHQGRLDPTAAMGSPLWAARDPRQALSWKTWLQMVDGQRYVEIGAPSFTQSDAAKKLFGPGVDDVARYCAGLPTAHPAGTFWNYNSCGIVLTADALTRKIVPDAANAADRRGRMSAWMRASLFEPIGMRSALVEFDNQGLFFGSALIYASARDYAKFGLLYLHDGVWDGRRLLPAGWVQFASTPGPAANADIYGAGWWVTPRAGPGRPYHSLIQGAPRDAYSAQGFEGQYIVIVPSKDLVIVRLGRTPESEERLKAMGAWMTALVRAFPDAPIP